MANDDMLKGTARHLMANYGRLPVALVRGSGAKLWDADGKQYIDLFAGFGAAALGHCHPRVVEAIRKQAGELMCVGNLFTWESQITLARKITEHGFSGAPAKVFFCHSGAEANEAALKLARLAAGEGRYKIISFENSFHGRTMGALSLTPKKFQKGFEPMLPGNIHLPLGDLKLVEQAIDAETAGIIVEPIQGEGGIYVPPAAFMQGLRKLCDAHGLALICDEVWTAPARTGRWYGFQLHGIEPDILTLGKAVGGGVPVAACVGRGRFADVLTPGTHGCTLGGNPVCAAAGVAVYEAIEQDDLLAAAVARGKQIVDALQAAKLPRVKEIRGHGLMLGVQLDGPGKAAFAQCLENGVMINVTQESIIRLAPPLTIGQDELAQGLDVLIAALRA